MLQRSCSSAALSKNTAVAAAIARPACTRCLRGHRERKRSSVAFRLSAQGGQESQYLKNEYGLLAPPTTTENVLGYSSTKTANSSTWNHISSLGGEVGMEGGHGNCYPYRFGTLTGVRQGGHDCVAKKWINGQKSELKQGFTKCPTGK